MNNKIISKAIAGAVLCSMMAYVTPVFAYTKEETVYTKADSNGKAYKTVVSDHIQNTNKDSIINDLSDLLDITNTKGDETFTQDGTKLVWQADGNDIYYQGETSKELPITCEINYELDGKTVSADEIKGKSGKVKIIIQYTNNEKRGNMYVPFVVVAGTVINNDNSSNVEVTNGKVINDGSKTMVMGLAMPGLQESLGVSKSDIDIPDSIEITMDATDFEQKNIITYATSKVFDEMDLNIFDKMNELFNKVNELESASKQLVTGANTLKDGARQFSNKSQEFNSAMQKYSDGMLSAKESYNKINNGIATLDASSGQLNVGAKKIDEGLTQLSNLLKYLPGSDNTTQIATLTAMIQSETAEATRLGNTNSALETQKATIESSLRANGVEEAQITSMLSAINAQIAENANAITILNQQISLNTATIAALQATSSDSSNPTAATKLKLAIDELKAGADELYTGTNQLTSGTAELKAGSSKMKAGLGELSDSAKQLLSANGQLTEAAGTIANGSEELAEGVTKFNQEGIEKICNYINGDVKDVADRVEKLQDLAKDYNSYTALEKGNEGTVDFITVVDAITMEENKED